MKRIGRSVVAGGVCLRSRRAPRDARASGFATQHFGGEQGNVLTSNPTALYYNPAGIAFSEGIHLYLDGNIAIRHATWSHVAPQPGPSDQPESQAGNTGTAHLLNVFAGPTMAATGKFGNFAVGVGLFVPFGGRVNWATSDNTDPNLPLTAGGVQRWHMIDAALTFLQVTAGAAYKLGPFALGVTGNLINSQITETQAKTLAAGNIDSTIENTASLDVVGLERELRRRGDARAVEEPPLARGVVSGAAWARPADASRARSRSRAGRRPSTRRPAH